MPIMQVNKDHGDTIVVLWSGRIRGFRGLYYIARVHLFFSIRYKRTALVSGSRDFLDSLDHSISPWRSDDDNNNPHFIKSNSLVQQLIITRSGIYCWYDPCVLRDGAGAQFADEYISRSFRLPDLTLLVVELCVPAAHRETGTHNTVLWMGRGCHYHISTNVYRSIRPARCHQALVVDMHQQVGTTDEGDWEDQKVLQVIVMDDHLNEP